MATSAATLTTIISELSKKYKFDQDKAIIFLSGQDLLPKKMLPKDLKDASVWASKKAQELASQHDIEPTGEGSGKSGKWTLADVEKAIGTPKKKSVMLVSPNALNLANEHKLSLVGKNGSGKDGRILLKDVEKWLANDDDDDDDDINISPRALQEAHELGIKDDELSSIQGSGVDGRILLADVKTYYSSTTDKSDDED